MAQTAAVKQSKANARAQKQLGHNTWRKAFMQHYWLYIMMLPALPNSIGETSFVAAVHVRLDIMGLPVLVVQGALPSFELVKVFTCSSALYWT